LRRAALTAALILSCAGLCNAQEAAPACDFSSRKPLVISHPLYHAVAKKVGAEYPQVAQGARAEGTVEVRILVDKKGRVAEACAMSGHLLLREAARKAALGWAFAPNFGFSKGSKFKQHYIQASLNFHFRLAY
jgi:TonB family protein